MEKISVLIVDDHPVFRFGLRSLIFSIPALASAVLPKRKSKAASSMLKKSLENGRHLSSESIPSLYGQTSWHLSQPRMQEPINLPVPIFTGTLCSIVT